MSKLKFYITAIIGLFCAVSFSQDRQYIYFDNLDSEAIGYSVGNNYERASFYIYGKGYETKKKRDSIKKAQIKERDERRKQYKLPARIPPTGTAFYASTPPERIESLEGINFISPKEYREGKITTTRFYIITPCKEGGYLKWMANSSGSE